MNGKFERLSLFAAFGISLCLQGFLFIQSKGVEGGMDSWNHFLISKSAIQHPELLLDQWNKPVFTWITVLICQLGMNALIVFNIFCVAWAGLLMALSMHKKGFSNTWSIVLFVVFTPILFGNTISGLTEPLNVLFLALFCYFWVHGHYKTALIVASFLPFVRTEGFVLCGAVLLLVLYEKKYKLIPYLFIGSVVLNMVGWYLTDKPFWIISENPYWKHETEGTFEAGSGAFSHFFLQARSLFGLPMEILLLISFLILALQVVKRQKVDALVLFSLLAFFLYFMAHTTIYYFGILGSHGLSRVMAVIAPPLAILSYYSIYTILEKLPRFARLPTYLFLSFLVLLSAYRECAYAKPYQFDQATVKEDKSQINFIKAGQWLEENNLLERTIIHQSPYFDVAFEKDPYDIKSSYRVWSIDQKNDWAEKGVIVIWDGFSAVREGNMPLDWLQNNSNYRLMHYIEGFEKPEDNPKMYDIYIWEKVGP